MTPPFRLTQGPADSMGTRHWYFGIRVSGERDRNYIVSDEFARLMGEWQESLGAPAVTSDAFIPVDVDGRWGIAAMTAKRARVVAFVIGDEGTAAEVATLMSMAHAEQLENEPF